MNSLERQLCRYFSVRVSEDKTYSNRRNQVMAPQYELLGKSIKGKGKPSIKYYPKLESSGYYEPGPNTLWFKFPSTGGDLVKQSVIVHEATHAILDMNSADVMIGDAEAIAYVAQCQYYIINNIDSEKR